jgi:5-methylcytosine-specific restriction endonuclease McrA
MPNKPKARQTEPPPKPWRHKAKATERGYGWVWDELSRRFRAEQPLCELCLTSGKVTAAASVHHIDKIEDAPERRLVRANLIALCRECHKLADRNHETNQRCRTIAEAREDNTTPGV